MDIPQNIINEVHDSLRDTFKPIYTELLKDIKKVEYEEYLQVIARDIWDELENLIEITNETLYSVAKRRQVTKKRWVKREFETDHDLGLNKSLEVAELLYKQQIETFSTAFGYNNFTDFKKVKLKELKTWETSEEIPLSTYPYIKQKQLKQIESAISNDVEYAIIKFMKEKYPKGEQGKVITLPSSMTNLPYDHTNRKKIKKNELVDNKYLKEIYYTDRSQFETRYNVEVLEARLLQENVKWLNENDQRILEYLFSLKPEALYRPVPMVVEIGEIVRNAFGSDGKKNYMVVKESLIKMDSIEIRATDRDSLLTTKVEIFHKATIEIDEISKKEVARIIFSEDINREFVKNQTVSVYKDVIDKFKLNSSKVLIYPLQGQRIACDAQNEKNRDTLIFNTNLVYFQGVLVMTGSRMKTQIDVIEKALDEIVENKIFLKKYSRKGHNFTLEFYPLSEKERRDLLPKNLANNFLIQSNNEEDKEQLELSFN